MLNLESDSDKRKYIIGFHIANSLICKIFIFLDFFFPLYVFIAVVQLLQITIYVCNEIHNEMFSPGLNN